MSDYPRVVTVDTMITWDGVRQRLVRGQVMDVPPGSALEAAIGADRLRPLHARGAVPRQPQRPAQQPQPGTRDDGKPAALPATEDTPALPPAAAGSGNDNGDGGDREVQAAPRRVRAAKTDSKDGDT
jgi:hypothetical protein